VGGVLWCSWLHRRHALHQWRLRSAPGWLARVVKSNLLQCVLFRPHRHFVGDADALLARQRTYDLQVVGSSPGCSPLRSGLGQATYTCVPLSQSSIIWYRPRGRVISLAGKVTVSLVESNVGSLPPGSWLMSPAGWLSRNRDQLHSQR